MRAVTEIDRPELIWSESAIEGTVRAGEQYTGTVTLRASDGRTLAGMILSEERRILLAGNELAGEQCEIVYGIDTKGLVPGDVIEGALVVLCDFAQGTLPVQIRVEGALAQDGVQTIEAFTTICRERPREAFRLFTDARFAELLASETPAIRALYRGLAHNPITYEHMESFLVASGQKKALEFSLDKEGTQFFGISKTERGTIYLYKNTWGFARLDVCADADFIRLPHRQISTESFVGRVYELEYEIDPSKLGRGVRRGVIRISGLFGTLTYEVFATRMREENLFHDHRRIRRRAELAKSYLALRQKRIDFRTWSDQTRSLVDADQRAPETTAEDLLIAAWYALECDDLPGAMELLWPIKDGAVALELPRERAAYLSLARETSLLPEEEMEIVARLEEEARRAPGDYITAELLHREKTAKGRVEMPEEAYARLSALYQAGCDSPFLYQDIWELFERDASLLGKLSLLNLRVLMYAQRYGLMTEKVLSRAAFLSHNLKRFSRPLYHLLAKGYQTMPTREMLEAICRLILKGQPVQAEYAPWYRRAIEQNLRITQLYEYYMESVPAEDARDVPLPVLMYFSENDTIGASRRAMLYAGIIARRQQDSDMYRLYRDKMRAFAEESLSKGLISEDYAALYRTFFSRPHDPRSAGLLAGVLFAHRMDIDDRRARRVVITYDCVEQEQSWPVTDQTAWVRYYGDTACVLFEDDQHRRYRADGRFRIKALMNIEEGIPACLAMGIRHEGLLLCGCGEDARHVHVDDKNLAACRLASNYEALTPSYRNALKQAILSYYLSHPDDFGRLEFTGQMNADDYARADKSRTVELLVSEGKAEQAFELVTEYGFEGIPTALLLQLASNMIERREGAFDEELLYLTAHVAGQEKYNETMLGYLRDHLDGRMEHLCALRERLAGFQLDALPLEEKILRQAVFTRTFPEKGEEILDAFWRGQGNRGTIAAYLGEAAVAHLTEQQELTDVHLRCMRELYESGNPISTAMKLCLLESCAQPMGTEERERAAEELAEKLLAELLVRGIRLGFYRNLPRRVVARHQLEDKVFVEAVAPARAAVEILYQKAGTDQWIAERMQDLCHGIRSREFLLLYGEEIRFRIRVTCDGKTTETPEQTLRGEGAAYGSRTRLAMVDRMRRALESGDEAGCAELVRRCRKADACVEQLFELQ